jgi:hypothetical protein
LGPAPHLDGKYTIFGALENGYDVLEQMENIPVDANSKPDIKLTVLQAEVVDAKDLEKYLLAHPASVPDVSEITKRSESSKTYVALVIMIFGALCGLAIALLNPVRNRLRTSLAILLVLCNGFGTLILASLEWKNQIPILGAALFMGLVAIFKLLGRFDTPEA